MLGRLKRANREDTYIGEGECAHRGVAGTVDEACEPEAGFEYVTDIAEKKLFRKRK